MNKKKIRVYSSGEGWLISHQAYVIDLLLKKLKKQVVLTITQKTHKNGWVYSDWKYRIRSPKK